MCCPLSFLEELPFCSLKHPLAQETRADFVHGISMEINAAGSSSTPSLSIHVTIPPIVEVLFSHCYSNASVFCAWFPILICLASAFNTDSFSDLVNEIKTP